jgi:hypothetical protein
VTCENESGCKHVSLSYLSQTFYLEKPNGGRVGSSPLRKTCKRKRFIRRTDGSPATSEESETVCREKR